METLSTSTTPTFGVESVVSLICGARAPSTARCHDSTFQQQALRNLAIVAQLVELQIWEQNSPTA